MLKDLVQALVNQSSLRSEFRRDPARVLHRFEVTPAEHQLLLEQNEAGLVAALGAELLSSFRDVDQRGSVSYPGAARLIVEGVKRLPGKAGGIEVSVGWDHDGEPMSGLPSWVQLDITGASGQPWSEINSYRVPSQLDLDACTATIKWPTPLTAGEYHLVLRVTHPEVRDSKPYKFVIEG